MMLMKINGMAALIVSINVKINVKYVNLVYVMNVHQVGLCINISAFLLVVMEL